jgi:hypothetical protein
LLGSVLLHLLLFWPLGKTWRLISWLPWQRDRMVVRMIPRSAHANQLQAQGARPDPGEPKPAQARTAPEPQAPATSDELPPAQSGDPDEGYLPQEYLSNAARPEDDIDLQDIVQPAVPGSLQLQVWIDHRGVVTRVDLGASEAPGWFTDQVIDRFKQSRFNPGQRDGKPVACIMRIEVVY